MKYSRKITLTSVVLSSVLLTGCFFQDVPSTNDNGSSKSSPTKTLSSSELKEFEKNLPEDQKVGNKKFTAPADEGYEVAKEKSTVTEEENKAFLKELAEKPMGIDVQKIEIPEIVETSYPSDTFDVHEGARLGLSFYETITHEAGLYEARDTSKDWSKFYAPYEAKILPAFKNDLKKSVDGGQAAMDSIFLITDSEGVLFKHFGEEKIYPAMMPIQEYSEPVLGVGYLEDYGVDYMHVQGNKLISFKATNGKMYYVQLEYTIRMTNLHDDEWVVSSISSIPTDVKVM